jgi:hypothetical protein
MQDRPKKNWYSPLIIKIVRQITEARMPLISVRKHHRIGFDRPIYTEVLIIPENARVMVRAVIGSYLIINLGFLLKGAKAVKETGRHP